MRSPDDQICVHVDAGGPPEGDEIGQRSVDGSTCPKCGAKAEYGFGLAYGGYGPYEFCSNDCGWFWKRRKPHNED